MLLGYIIFGFLIAALSVYGLFVFAEVGWRTGGVGRGKESVPGKRFMPAHRVKSASPQPKALPANTARKDRETELNGAGMEFQWGEFTLRELEERLTRDAQGLSSEAWKREA